MSKNELLALIELKRKELGIVAIKYGLHSNTTIRYSQELDHLLNLYDRNI
ncbi:MAG: Spo0E family sporulation regulatory protein-aspartic acid phosphatase [Bacillus sp. (in: firmicutes)]